MNGVEETQRIKNKAYVMHCYFCDSEFLDTDTLKAHMIADHTPGKPGRSRRNDTLCPEKEKECESEREVSFLGDEHSEYSDNMNNCSDTTDEEGNEPDEVKFEVEHDEESFINEEGEDVSLECNMCENLFSDNESLRIHMMKKHKRGMRELQCDRCPYKTYRGDSLKRHRQTLHEKSSPVDKSKLVCEQCGYTTARPRSMREHLRVHNGVKYTCELCGKTFTRDGNLKTHMQIHSGIIFMCDQCDFTTNRKDSLSSHVKFKHMGVKFPCNLCSGSFTRERDLKRHIDSMHKYPTSEEANTPKVKYPCYICQTSFCRERDMRRHVRTIHTDSKSESAPPVP